MVERNSTDRMKSVSDLFSGLDVNNVPEENVDELQKLLARVKELTGQPVKKPPIPPFAILTNHGLREYKNMTVQDYKLAEHTYILSNGEQTVSISEDTYKELTVPVPRQKDSKETQPKYESLVQSQYDDFFKLRQNNACNFRHNLSVYCRKEANSPLDAIKISRELIGRMNKEEREKTRALLNNIKRDDETINQVLVGTYMDAIKDVPLNEQYIKDNFPDKKIARPFYDTMTSKGSLIDPESTLRIGDRVNNLSFNAEKIFGSGKERIFQNLTVVSSSKEGNNVILMDDRKSFFEVPRDQLLSGYNKQQRKLQKAERKQQMRNRLEMER